VYLSAVTTRSAEHDSAGIVEVGGAQLRYRIEGHGQPCLVVGSAIFYPRMFSQELREHLQLVFADLRHFAASAGPSFGPDRITVDTFADDIEQVRRTLGLGDVIVIGHSIHGTIALEYARRYPEHVRGVVAIGAVPAEDPAEVERQWEADASEERKEFLARQQAELTPEVRAAMSPADLLLREYVANGPVYWYDPAYDCSWMWDEVVPDMPVLSISSASCSQRMTWLRGRLTSRYRCSSPMDATTTPPPTRSGKSADACYPGTPTPSLRKVDIIRRSRSRSCSIRRSSRGCAAWRVRAADYGLMTIIHFADLLACADIH